MKYLKVVQNASEIVDVVVPSVYYIKDTEEVRYYGDAFRPLTFVAREDGMTVSFTGTCSYSIDGSTWVELAANTATPAINTGESILFRKEVSSTSSSIGTFSATKAFDVKGNIMSMLFGKNFIEKNTLSGFNYCFKSLFQLAPVVDASKLSLPATTLASNCYASMFQDCTSLTQAPELPATTLDDYCYISMFNGCTSLTQAPELPATTVKTYCYSSMFQDCTSLTQAPELPATTLASNCYNSMFEGCTRLTQAPELPATTLLNSCYAEMFYKCTSLTKIVMLATNLSASTPLANWVSEVATSGTFVKAAGVTIPSGASGIPNGWTVEER